MSCKSILLLTSALVLAPGEQLFEPCSKDDLQCLKTATNSFMSRTYPGDQKFGIAPMDPLTISSLEVLVDDKSGLVFNFSNIQVTGLKNFETIDFKLDKDKKSVVVKLKANIKVTSEIEINVTKWQKTFKAVEETETYGYDFTTKDGKKYFEIGPESPTCEVYGTPTEEIPKALEETLDGGVQLI